jgi:D-arabinose 1-dehydrogenase-like Zn-dependent alcohol dehydrogenase
MERGPDSAGARSRRRDRPPDRDRDLRPRWSLALGGTPFLLPLHFGHECVAEVLSVGERVATVKPGDRVVVPFQISCGSCGACRAGLTANCEAVPPVSMYGFGVGGGHWGGAVSDELAVPYADGMLVPLPSGVQPAARRPAWPTTSPTLGATSARMLTS